MYFNVGIYNVELRLINVVYFNVDMNNVRQRRNNVVIFHVEFHNVGQRQNVAKTTISKNSKFLLFHNLIHFTPHVKRNMSKNICKAEKFLKDYEKYCIGST